MERVEGGCPRGGEEEGGGRPSVCGEKEGATKKGKRGKRPALGFLCGRNETTPQMTLT
jgi:hypothetical protein